MEPYATPTITARRILPPALALLAITGAFLYFGGNGLLKTIRTIPAYSLCALLALPCLRWLFLLTRLQLLFMANGLRFRHRDVLATQCAYDFATETTPGNIGGAPLILACCRIFRIPVSSVTGISLLTLTLDVVAASLVFSIALARSTFVVNQSLHWQLTVFFTFVFTILASLWALARFRRPLLRQLSRIGVMRRIRKPHARKAQRFWRRTEMAIKRVRNLTVPAMLLVILSSIGIWASRLSVIYFVIRVIPGIHSLSWPDALIIQFVSSLAGILVLLPGGLLGADITVATLLSPYFDMGTIVTIILLWRLLTFHVNFLAGSVAVLWISSLFAAASSTPGAPRPAA